MCGRCDSDLDHDVENRCGLESASCVGLTYGMASTVFIVALMRCRIRKWKNTRAHIRPEGPEVILLSCPRS